MLIELISVAKRGTKATSRVSCQKGPTRHAYAWQIRLFWQDTVDMYVTVMEAIA